MKKKNYYFIYFLVAYVILQYVWWTYFIIKLGEKTDRAATIFWMLVGEGGVFLFVIIFTFSRLIISLKREEKLNNQKNNFLLSVTHELKTPIAHNKLTLQTLLKRKDLDEDKRNALLEKILVENNRLEHLVENILTSTRIETNNFNLSKETFNLGDLVEKIVERYAILLADSQVNITKSQPSVFVVADQKMIETVLINLIENYHKYALDSESLSINITTFGEKAKCSFADLGTGVPLNYQKEIFKKFVRMENEEIRTKKGTGLGLYIAKEFLKLNNGNIVYLPNKPNGAIFELTLPLA
jgi:K+-sensing histidine kinase KdpD